MAGMKISELDFVRLLPAFMRDDEAVIAFSKAMNDLMGEPAKRIGSLRTWDKIDELDEAECDEMAWELDIDWYDSEGMTLDEKRETIKTAQQIKRKRGTKWAVESLIASFLGEGYVAEWHEIGGEPYTFVALITSTEVTTENFQKFMQIANIAKNERSHMTGVYYYWPQGFPEDGGVAAAPGQSVHQYTFTKCGTRYRPAVVGFVARPQAVETEPEVTAYRYDFPECGDGLILATEGAAVVGTAIVNKTKLRSN